MIQTKISWARFINNVTNTKDAFRWTASFIKSGRLSSEGFLVLAFAADLSTNHNESKVFLKSNNNLIKQVLRGRVVRAYDWLSIGSRFKLLNRSLLINDAF